MTSYITSQVPAVGGVIKARPSDFLVDEIPLYQPCGSGEHIYMLVQKTSMSTFDAADALARHFGVDRSAIGYAGLKDKHAITRQVFSVHTPGKKPEDFSSLEHPNLGVLWVDLHQNKLKRGHLAGNRFSIRIREVSPASVVRVAAVMKTLAAQGVPNRFGPQRFGLLANNHIIAARIIAGDYAAACDALLGPNSNVPHMNTAAREAYVAGDLGASYDLFPQAARAERSVLRKLMNGATHKNAAMGMESSTLEFYLSSFQSAIFNDILDARVAAGTLGGLISGDIAMKAENRATFPIDDAMVHDDITLQRLAAFEICASGPMWGNQMRRAGGAIDAAEVAALAAVDNRNITPETLQSLNKNLTRIMPGERRPLRVQMRDPDVEGGVDEYGAYVRCVFELPRGGFATTVMEEIMKTGQQQDTEE